MHFLKSLLVAVALSGITSTALAEENEQAKSDDGLFELRLGSSLRWLAVEWLTPNLPLNVEGMFSIGSVWRVGASYRFHAFKNWCHDDHWNYENHILLMNEFVLYHGDVFELAPRLGFGYMTSKGYEDVEANAAQFDNQYLGADLGMRFAWTLSSGLILGVHADYERLHRMNEFTEAERALLNEDDYPKSDWTIDLNFTLSYRF